MLDPHDDTDVPSGSTDGAQMESTSSPVPRLHPAASTHTNEFKRFEDKAGARDSARVHCPDSQALTATTTPSVVP